MGRTLYDRAKFASKSRTRTVASPCKATPSCEATLASPMVKRKAFKARPKAPQPNRTNFQSPRVSVMDRLGPVNTYLRNYLSTNRKFYSEEPAHIASSHCGQTRCQLVMVHSAYCYLENIQTAATPSNRSVFDRISAQTAEKAKSRKKKVTKRTHLAAASVNMISRGMNLFRFQRQR